MLTVFIIGAINVYGNERISQNPLAMKRLRENLRLQEKFLDSIVFYDYMYGFSQILFESLGNDEITKFVHKYTSLLQIFSKEEDVHIDDKKASLKHYQEMYEYFENGAIESVKQEIRKNFEQSNIYNLS